MYSSRRTSSRFLLKSAILIVAGILAVVTAAVIFFGYQNYQTQLQPLSQSASSKIIVIDQGSSSHDIAALLAKEEIIRSRQAFIWYVRQSGNASKIKAGTYALSASQSVEEIVNIITRGEEAVELVTILPGQRIDQVRSALINSGYSVTEVDQALDPASHQSHPALSDKPKDVSLEGYLYPETFQKTATTTAQDIIKKSLDEFQKQLTPELRQGIISQGLSVYEGIILASIVEREVPSFEDRQKAAQVFLTRLSIDMALQSDATASYGAILDGQTPSLFYDSPYNTYNNKGLPPTPISNVSRGSLRAVAQPANTDYLYFVSGDDGINYFSRSLEEHEALTRQHCRQLCSLSQ
jgi:UPF0755 protein